jgi:hypothetical protein
MITQMQQEALNNYADGAAEQIVDSLVLYENTECDDQAADAIAQAAFSFLRWLDATMDTRGFNESQCDHVLITVHRAIDARLELAEWFNQWDGER